jgi:PAS domain S-box-containing protein
MARWTIRGYSNQVRLFLFLVVFFLVMQSTLNFSLLFTARESLTRAAREQAVVTAEQVARELLPAVGGAPGRPVPAAHLARLARTRQLAEVAILEPGGKVVASSSGPGRGAPDPDLADLPSSERRRFILGREGVLLEVPWRGSGRLVVFRPTLEPSSGRVAGLVKVTVRPGDLLGLTRRIRLFAVIQAVGVAAVLLLTFAFIRWMLRPYRLLVRTAGQTLPVPTTEDQAVQSPDSLVHAFQGVVDTLNRQEGEIQSLRQGRSEAGDLHGPAFQDLPSGVVATDREGTVTAINPAGERILGVPAGSSTGRGYREVLGRSEDLVRLVGECLRGGTSRSRVLVRVRDGRGGASHVGASISPVESRGSGAPSGVLCIFSDLTEIRQVEERVRLRENLAEVGHISAGIAHEVRNSLATILGYARLATRAGADDGREHAGAICKEVEAIQGVLGDYLQFARPLSLNLERVDVGGLALELAATLRRTPAGRSARLEVLGEFAEVEGDEALLQQALGNLLRNALEAAGPEGRVALRGSLPPGGAELVVEVYDDGPGLPPDTDPEELFRPFYSTKREGTGLGLALARKTVVYHDGQLVADQGPWGGARFTVRLPVAPGGQEAARNGASRAGTF